MSTEDNPAVSRQPIELTPAELEAIAGGIDVSFTAVMFEQSQEVSAQQVQTDSEIGSSFSISSQFSFSLFQFTGSFESVGSARQFINNFSKLFGR